MIACSFAIDELAAIENFAAVAARKATNIVEYSPYAELRDGLRKAISALDEIRALPADVRERMEGGAA